MSRKDIQQLQTIKERMISAGITEEEVNAMVSPLENELKRRICGLVWEHTNTSIPDLEGKIPSLMPLSDKNIVTDLQGDNHILIEGENLLALMAMQYTHIDENGKGMIDVIYIDPPYNTGSVSFAYNDKFEKSEWLSMMDIRLKLARNLLKDDGVIFISIDDKFQAECNLLLADIFGNDNFLAQFIVASNSTKNNAKFVSVSHEYVLCVCKNKTVLSKRCEQGWQVKKNYVDDFEKKARQLLKSGLSFEDIHKELLSLVKYPKYYDFDHYTYADRGGVFRTDNAGGVTNGNNSTEIIHPQTNKPCAKPSSGWRYSEEEIHKMLKNNMFYFGKDENTIPQPKRYLKDYRTQVPKSTLFFDSQSTTKWLKAQGLSFDFPKPIALIKYFLSIFSDDAIIFDFFAGSGTTGHAVLDLNKEDGGHRQFILCTNNELGKDAKKKTKKNGWEEGSEEYENLGVCHAVTYPRMQNIFPEYPGNNLYYYRIDQNITESAIDDVTIAHMSSQAVFYVAMKENVFNAEEHEDYYLLNNHDTEIVVVTDPDMDMFDVEEEITPDAFTKDYKKVYCSVYEPCHKDGIEYIPYPKEVLDVLKAAKKYIRREAE